MIGGGPTGLELGQAFQRLGSAVTVVEAGPRILARAEAPVAAALREALAGEGMSILTDTSVVEVVTEGGGNAAERVVRLRGPEGSRGAASRCDPGRGGAAPERRGSGAGGGGRGAGGRRRGAGRCAAADVEPAGVRLRRRDGRPSVHARGVVRGGSRAAQRPVPDRAAAGRVPQHALGRVHRPRGRRRGAQRGGGAGATRRRGTRLRAVVPGGRPGADRRIGRRASCAW